MKKSFCAGVQKYFVYFQFIVLVVIMQYRRILNSMEKTRLRNAILNAASRNAALVIKNARVVNVFTESIETADVAVRDGIILGVGSYSGKEEVDAHGAYLCPGLIDGHVHI